MNLLYPPPHAYGLDIGDNAFKAVQLERTPHRPRPYRIASWSMQPLPQGVMERGNIMDATRAAALVAKTVHDARGRIRGSMAVVNLPESKTFIQVFGADPTHDDTGREEAVRAEISRTIPLPLGEIYYDWQHFADPSTKDGHGRIVFGAAPKRVVDDLYDMLSEAGITPIAFEIEAMAVHRACVPLGGKEGTVGILDIGHSRSSLAIADRGVVVMSIGVPVSGGEITELISREMGIPTGEAELLKRQCGLDPERCENKLWKILLPVLDDMADKIRAALRYYRDRFPKAAKPDMLYLCGGGAEFRSLDKALSRKLALRTQPSRPLENVEPPHAQALPKGDELQFTTAIGLAIRAARENEKYQHLLR